MFAFSLNPIDWVTDAAGAVLGGAAESVLGAVVSWLEDGVRYVATAIAEGLAEMSSLDLGSQTAQQMGGVMKWVALAVAVGSIMVSAVFAAVSSEGSLHDTLREIPITLIMMAGWFGLMTVWTEAVTSLMQVWTTDALVDGLAAGVTLDPGIASFVRGFVALMLMIFLIIFFIEMLVLSHMLTFGVLIGQVAIAMRPVRPLRGVSGQMIRNMVTLSLVPALGVASLALSLGRLNEAGALSFQRALGALAGIVVSVLMPLVVAKFLPLGGQSSSVGRSLIGAGAQVAATGAAVATGGAVLAAGGLSKFVTAGGWSRRWWSRWWWAGGGVGGGGSGGGGGAGRRAGAVCNLSCERRIGWWFERVERFRGFFRWGRGGPAATAVIFGCRRFSSRFAAVVRLAPVVERRKRRWWRRRCRACLSAERTSERYRVPSERAREPVRGLHPWRAGRGGGRDGSVRGGRDDRPAGAGRGDRYSDRVVDVRPDTSSPVSGDRSGCCALVAASRSDVVRADARGALRCRRSCAARRCA